MNELVLSYELTSNGALNIPSTGKLTHTIDSTSTASDTVNLMELLKPMFVVKNDDGSIDTTQFTNFYMGLYDADKQDYVGFKSGEYSTYISTLRTQATDAGYPTVFDYESESTLTFIRTPEVSNEQIDAFDLLSEQVKQVDMTQELMGLRRCTANDTSITFRSKNVIEVIHPDLGVSYITTN